MPEEKTQSKGVAQRNVGHRFPEGHQRFGGRKKRTAQQARALADEMGVDPLEFMLSIIKSEVMDQTVIENGKQKKVKAVVPLDVRLDAAKTVIFPIAIPAIGILATIVGVFVVRAGKNDKNAMAPINRGVWTAAILTIAGTAVRGHFIAVGRAP